MLLIGNIKIEEQDVMKKILSYMLRELKDNKEVLLKIIGISLLCAILKHIQNNFGGNVSEIAFYVCYMLVIILIVTSFSNIISICLKSIAKLKNFMNVIIPVLLTLMLTMGNITTVAVVEPILLMMISAITNIISNFVLPIILISTIISLVGNICEEINVDKLGKFFKKSIMYLIEFMMIIFAGTLSIEGTLSAGVDGVASKISRTVVSNAVPVVGRLLGDAVDSVIGSIGITKNAVGTIGVIIIITIMIIPVIKSFALMTLFQLTSGVCELIADNRIAKSLSIVVDSMKMIFGIMIMVMFLFIISITIMLKMSNTSLLYQ